MSLVDVALIVLAVAFAAGLVRVARGPSIADRAVAADVCLFIVVAGLALLSTKLDAPAFLDAVLVATLLGFVATVSLSRLVVGGEKRRTPREADEARTEYPEGR